MSVELVSVDSPTALARRAAHDCLELIRMESGQAGAFTLALPGGRVAAPFFEFLTAAPEARELLVRNVHFFWADERCVPPDDPQSNYGLARRMLLDPLAVPPSHVHRWRTELEPAEAVEHQVGELRRIAARSQGSVPQLDLVLLGMGEDGHIASLFPTGQVLHSDPDALCLHVLGPKPPPHRLTFNYPLLGAARRVWVLVSGVGKEKMLKRAIQRENSIPLGQLLLTRQTTKIYTDLRV